MASCKSSWIVAHPVEIGSHVGNSLFLTWIFWTAGVASITTALGGGINCTTTPRRIVYCDQLNAAEAFAWIEWYATILHILSSNSLLGF